MEVLLGYRYKQKETNSLDFITSLHYLSSAQHPPPPSPPPPILSIKNLKIRKGVNVMKPSTPWDQFPSFPYYSLYISKENLFESFK